MYKRISFLSEEFLSEMVTWKSMINFMEPKESFRRVSPTTVEMDLDSEVVRISTPTPDKHASDDHKRIYTLSNKNKLYCWNRREVMDLKEKFQKELRIAAHSPRGKWNVRKIVDIQNTLHTLNNL